MPTRPHTQLFVTWKQVAAFRTLRHHLLQRTSMRALLPVVNDMAGAQAQLLSAAQISLWSRIRDLQVSHVEKALSERLLVKAACMRKTLFLVPSGQLAVFVRGTTRRAEKEVQWARGKGVPDRVLDAAIDATINVLDQPLTRPEIAERVSRVLGVRKQAVNGGGWGSRRKVAAVPVGKLTYPVVDLLHLSSARGIFCYGPSRDGEPTFVRADAWIPNWRDLPVEEAEDMLLHRYLQAFGPATVADFSMWSGISLTESRRIWARGQGDLVTVNVEGMETSILQEDLNKLAQAKFENPQIRLLPYFDSFLLGHKQREHLVEEQHRPKIYRPQGWIFPVVLVDGRVTAVWEQARVGNRLQVKVTKFEPLSRHVVHGMQEEAQDLGRFLGIPNVDVIIA